MGEWASVNVYTGTCSVIRRTKLLVRWYHFPLKSGWSVRTSTEQAVNDAPLVSMVKDTDRSTVSSDGSRNKIPPRSTITQLR